MPDSIIVDDEPGSELGGNLNLTQLDHDGDGKAGGSLPKAKRGKKAEDFVWIVLEENDDIPPTGLPVSHNGDAFIIRTGEPQRIPAKLLGILDDAIMAAPQIDPTTRRVIGYRPRMRFPYRKVAAPETVE